MQIDPPDLVKTGQFYFIYDRPPHLVMEDKTKRGLEVRERAMEEKQGVDADLGMIHDMDGIGHKVGIRWYFPKAQYAIEQVVQRAEEMEKRYRAIREMTCPDDE
jgi:hypothetical protein